jgi:NADH-quinone oxidoreductase subunit M
VLQKSFFGEPTAAENHAAHPLPPITIPERLGAFILIAATVVIGVYPNGLLRIIADSFTSPLFDGLRKGGGF